MSVVPEPPVVLKAEMVVLMDQTEEQVVEIPIVGRLFAARVSCCMVRISRMAVAHDLARALNDREVVLDESGFSQVLVLADRSKRIRLVKDLARTLETDEKQVEPTLAP